MKKLTHSEMFSSKRQDLMPVFGEASQRSPNPTVYSPQHSFPKTPSFFAGPATPQSPQPRVSTQHSTTSTSMAKIVDPDLLNKIDKLFECNVGHYIDLPQLVVVGDQSSGKSSVLQGLTNLPFPRDSGLCTRFATQIIFRRGPEERVSIRTIPAKGADNEHQAKVRAWSKQDLKNLDQDTFGKIMEEVHVVMGIAKGDSSMFGMNKTFSGDVLLLEVCGPNEEHFSVIDVPGIFKKTTFGVTTQADMQMVQDMVESYVSNPRSVILAVVPANVDTATQSILDMAEKHDREGLRTLGVLTKPDLVDSGAENRVMDLLEGKAHQLELGWCMVRNLGQKESEDSKDRHAVEKSFFSTTAPWNTLNEDQFGVEALQARLRELLGTLTRREFPKVRAELNKMLKDKKTALEALGPKRDTFEEQANYLTRVASEFQALSAHPTTSTNYAIDSKLALKTLFVNRNDSLSDTFAKFGHKYKYGSKSKAGETAGDHSAADDPSDDSEHASTTTRPRNKPQSRSDVVTVSSRETDLTVTHPEIEDILTTSHVLKAPEANTIFKWLKEIHKGSRGLELGTFDPGLLAVAMHVQSENWETLALGYISDVIAHTHLFVVDLIHTACRDERVARKLVSHLTERLVVKYERAMAQAKFILQVERSNTPLTTNHYFNDNVEKNRQKRLRTALKRYSSRNSDGSYKESEWVRLDDVMRTDNMSNLDNLIQHIHDILQSYYKVARKRVVDVLCMQAANYHLLSGPDTPLTILIPEFVRTLSVDDMESIAGETPVLSRKRAELAKAIVDLEKGKKILL